MKKTLAERLFPQLFETRTAEYGCNFFDLSIGDCFQLCFASVDAVYDPVFRKLGDHDEKNAEIVGVDGEERFASLSPDSRVRVCSHSDTTGT